jgi:hypothetical protein
VIDDFEESDFDGLLNFGEKFFPEVGVGCRGEVRETKSELGGCEVPALVGILSWVRGNVPLSISI